MVDGSWRTAQEIDTAANADVAAGGQPPLPPPADPPSPLAAGDVHLSVAAKLGVAPPTGARDDNQASPKHGKGNLSPTSQPEEDLRNTEMARLVSLISLVVSFVAAALGFGFGFAEEALTLIGFGLEASLDGVSSALVLWRFKRPKAREHQDDAAAARQQAMRAARRERNSAVGIGATFVASCILLLLSAAYKLTSWDPNSELHLAEERKGANYSVMLSVPSIVVFGALAVAKFRLARALGSQVLEKDALCSVLGAVLAAIVSVTGIIEEASGSPDTMVVIDSAASTIIAVILLVEGSRTLWHNLGSGWQGERRPLP